MQPHTLSCSCAGLPVIKLTGAWDSELKKCLLPGTITVTGCKCTRLCHADNHPSAAGNNRPTWRRVSRGQRAIELPSMSFPSTRPVRAPVQPWSPSVTRVTRSLWSPLWCVGGTRRPNLKAASRWQDRALLEATQWGQVITAAPFKGELLAVLHSITLGTGCFSCPLSIFTNTLDSYREPGA